MAFSIDVLNTTLQELADGYAETFLSWHPLNDYIIFKQKNVNYRPAAGPWIEFDVITGGPGQVKQIVYGDEVLPAGRRQNSKKGNAYAPFLMYTFQVPMKDLREANNKNDMARILKAYPEVALKEFAQYFAQQLGRGDGSSYGLQGFPTLNGNASYSPAGTSLTGIMSYAAPASQTSTVFGLVKQGGASGVTGWYNQYGNISSMSTDGRKTIRSVYEQILEVGSSLEGQCDLLISDRDSYLNYIDTLDEQVRVSNETTQAGDRAGGLNKRNGIKFLNADWYPDPAIDRSNAQFSGTPAANGLIYMFSTDSWEFFSIKGSEGGKDMDIGPAIRIPDQPVYQYEMSTYFANYTRELRRNGCVTGGAIE